MFCMNCGKEIMNTAKFCMNCGAKIDYDIQEEKINVKESKTKNCTTRTYEIFRKYFPDNNLYGNKIIIVGENTMSLNIKSNVDMICNGENPIMIFNYGKDAQEGFVITEEHIIFYYGYKGPYKFKLNSIKTIRTGKATLADIMDLITFDMIRSEHIYLTGINNVDRFTLKFNDFIQELNNCQNNNHKSNYEGEQDSEYMDEDDSDFERLIQEIENILVKICTHFKFSSTYCEIGTPLTIKGSKKYGNAVRNFNIEDDEDIFLIYDTTVMGGCENGLAICTYGIYYCNAGKKGFIDWEEYLNADIIKGLMGIKINGVSFNTGTDGKKLYSILAEIQQQLNQLSI